MASLDLVVFYCGLIRGMASLDLVVFYCGLIRGMASLDLVVFYYLSSSEMSLI
jgi:hypothetical protein